MNDPNSIGEIVSKVTWTDIVVIITCVIGIASIIVRITPSPKDDTILAAIKKFIGKFIALNP